MKESLETLMKSSYAFNKNIFNSNPKWAIIKELYDKNFVYTDRQVMPKKIHQIWLGSELPRRYRRLTETWKEFHPDWEYRLWTDKDVNDVDIPRRELFDSIPKTKLYQGQRSDFLRYHILKQYGGSFLVSQEKLDWLTQSYHLESGTIPGAEDEPDYCPQLWGPVARCLHLFRI